MSSLNQIVSEIAHAIHQPNNFTARRTIRSAIIHTFNEQIRQTYQRHANVDKILMQRYRISLINVPDGDIFQTLVSTKYKVKRSKDRVPRPVRLDNNLPFVSVRTVGYDNMAIPFIKEANAQFYKALPGMCTSLSYDYINGYLYVNSNGNPLIEPLGHIIIESPFEIQKFVREIRSGDYNSFFQRLQSFFADTTYEIIREQELHYENVLFIIFKLVGFYVKVEYHTSRGRIDLVLQTDKFIYIMEFKLNGTAEEALQQINDKHYALPFETDGRRLFKIGVNFSAETRNIEKWIVE